MIAVITGDVINSSEGEQNVWLACLKSTLQIYGKEPQNWEIYRGDSFQLSLPVDQALKAAFHLKSSIKTNKSKDIRMGIGIGEESFSTNKITESNGPAYLASGECFDSLGKNSTLAFRSQNTQFDTTINLMLDLAMLTVDGWSETVSLVVKTKFDYPEKNQMEIAGVLNKSQSSISEALKRGGFDEIQKLIEYYSMAVI